MKLYRISYHDHLTGWGYSWTGTQKDTKDETKRLKDSLENEPDGDPSTVKHEPVEVPTDKQGLLDFLNTHAAGDAL